MRLFSQLEAGGEQRLPRGASQRCSRASDSIPPASEQRHNKHLSGPQPTVPRRQKLDNAKVATYTPCRNQTQDIFGAGLWDRITFKYELADGVAGGQTSQMHPTNALPASPAASGSAVQRLAGRTAICEQCVLCLSCAICKSIGLNWSDKQKHYINYKISRITVMFSLINSYSFTQKKEFCSKK